MTPVESLTRDVSLALRRLIRTPGFTLIAVLSLSLGIGVKMRPQVYGTRRRIANMARSRASNVSGSSSAIT